MRYLYPPTTDQAYAPAVEALNLSQWITREVPTNFLDPAL